MDRTEKPPPRGRRAARLGFVLALLGALLIALGALAWRRWGWRLRPDQSVAAEERVEDRIAHRLDELGAEERPPVFLRIYKEPAQLEAWVEGPSGAYVRYGTYPVCRVSGGLGPKLAEGDRQAPEGVYGTRRELLNPRSRYHLSFNVGYPNAHDRAHGRTGSAIMVHGDCVSIGCFAMTDEVIEELYVLVARALEEGQAEVPVHIFPFALTPEALRAHRDHEWIEHWRELAPIWRAFEQTRRPPGVEIRQGRYVLAPEPEG